MFDPEPGELDLGLYYYEARFYSPTIGQLLQTDPIGTKDDLNLYAYVGAIPVNRVDPTGLAKVDVGSKTPTQVAAVGDLKCQGFSAGCQNGGTYGSAASYYIEGRNEYPSCAVKMLGVENEPAAVKAITLKPFEIRGK
ncbi:RHS repeat-associated core domain-containing protein [Burkholderia sp. PAMC 28687]|uniref:RHS repeat-associated core domain-containing protein n=1 Tax=Burkholderia sp. PAMC 28687 TaxID=1795874 RepID=UPI003FA4BD59